MPATASEFSDPGIGEVSTLIDAGRLVDAETRLKEMLARRRSLLVILALVDLLTRQRRISETETLLGEALALDPASSAVRLRRAAYYGRIGLLTPATDELALARRFIKPSDLEALLYWQELDRWLREASRTSFVLQGSLPRLPSWLKRSRQRKTAAIPKPQEV
jgi:hypothetical protein